MVARKLNRNNVVLYIIIILNTIILLAVSLHLIGYRNVSTSLLYLICCHVVTVTFLSGGQDGPIMYGCDY